VADVAAAADAVDALPLGRAGFTQETLEAARDFLLKADPKLAPMIAEHGAPERLLKKTGPNFPTLAKAIVFQARAFCFKRVIQC
jgi:3-methyladenine DNA glycosylase/8-oxoguanine DNA glycosylase